MTDHDAKWRAALRDMDRLLTSVARETADSPVGRVRPRRLIWPWAGAAAAAAVASVVFMRGPETPLESPPPASAEAPLSASLEAEAPRPFIVLQTDNPQIAVVWLLEETS